MTKPFFLGRKKDPEKGCFLGIHLEKIESFLFFPETETEEARIELTFQNHSEVARGVDAEWLLAALDLSAGSWGG